MDTLEKAGLVAAADRREFLSNRLVVVVPKTSTQKIASAADLADLPKIALADPAAVPAGIYAKKWLTGLGLWEKVEPKVVPTLDVRAALAAVESEAVPAAVVYSTDAAIAKNVKVAFEVKDGPQIVYSVAALSKSKNRASGRGVRPVSRRRDGPRRVPAARLPDPRREVTLTAEDVSVLLLTLRIAALATLIILPLGVGAAYLLARRHGLGRSLAETLLTLPLVLPPTAVGFLLLELLRGSRPIGRLLDHAGIELLFTWKAVVLATAVMSFPLLVRPALAAFEDVDPRLLGMARSLGSGPAAVFGRVALPLAWRGILAGALLAFSRALGEFGATILIAGKHPGAHAHARPRHLPAQPDRGRRGGHAPGGGRRRPGLRGRLDDRGPDAAPFAADRRVIELDDVTLPLARFPLRVSATLAGPAIAVLGPSGSGKTSLLETIAGLRRKASGRIAIDGEVLMDSADGRLPASGTAPHRIRPAGRLPLPAPGRAPQRAVRDEGRPRGRLRRGRRDPGDRAAARAVSRRRSPAANGSASRWPAPSRRSRACSCSTSRSRPSTGS